VGQGRAGSISSVLGALARGMQSQSARVSLRGLSPVQHEWVGWRTLESVGRGLSGSIDGPMALSPRVMNIISLSLYIYNNYIEPM
jgi:hypothetical protein